MVFKTNPANLERMLEMRNKGWTYEALGMVFGVDHSSIYLWCKSRKIPRPTHTIAFDLATIIRDIGIQVTKQKVKSYQDYLDEEHNRQKHRKLKSLYHV